MRRITNNLRRVAAVTASVSAVLVPAAPAFADGVVDAADYTVWRSSYGAASATSGDFDADGTVDGQDFLVWQRGDTAQTREHVLLARP